MAVFTMAGELFGSFFLTRNELILLSGGVLALFSVVGAWNRLRIRQKDAGEEQETAESMQHALLILCGGMALFLAAFLYWQYARQWLPEFRGPGR